MQQIQKGPVAAERLDSSSRGDVVFEYVILYFKKDSVADCQWSVLRNTTPLGGPGGKATLQKPAIGDLQGAVACISDLVQSILGASEGRKPASDSGLHARGAARTEGKGRKFAFSTELAKGQK